MNHAFVKSYECLGEVYNGGAFSTIALNKTLASVNPSDRALVTKIVYGVLENDIKLTYVLSKFCRKMPKGDTLLCLKIGVYCLTDLSIPPYAVVNDVAELSKVTGDVRQVGFVNATLKAISNVAKTFDDYPENALERVSVVNSYPLWALKKLVKDYGEETALKIASFRLSNLSTVRVAGNKTDALDGYITENTPFADAFYVKGRLPVDSSYLTAQSLSSMVVARVVASDNPSSVLDVCSAPGGKAVYVKQLCPDSSVTACDLHPHRVELIDAYAKRMGAKLTTCVADATVNNPEWNGAFDTVLCDVPCSGFGVLNNRPDIKLFRQNEDLSALIKTQSAILQNASRYVKKGGRLVYSTCTVFDHENGNQIRKFLAQNPEFQLGSIVLPEFPLANGKPCYQFLPHVDGVQGFFVAVLVKSE